VSILISKNGIVTVGESVIYL